MLWLPFEEGQPFVSDSLDDANRWGAIVTKTD